MEENSVIITAGEINLKMNERFITTAFLGTMRSEVFENSAKKANIGIVSETAERRSRPAGERGDLPANSRQINTDEKMVML